MVHFGNKLFQSIDSFIYINLAILYLYDCSMIVLLFRCFFHLVIVFNEIQRPIMNAYSLRISSIVTIIINCSFMIFHSVHYQTSSIFIDFVGTPKPTFLGLLSLDIVIVHFQLLVGLLLFLDSSEIVLAQPYFRYTISHSDQLPAEEIDELLMIPKFQIDYLQFLFGILWGMNVSFTNPSRVVQELRTSFRWRMIRLNSQLRNRTRSSDERLLDIGQASRNTRSSNSMSV